MRQAWPCGLEGQLEQKATLAEPVGGEEIICDILADGATFWLLTDVRYIFCPRKGKDTRAISEVSVNTPFALGR